jgi:hypothetical protein
MPTTDYSGFGERLAEACRIRKTTPSQVARSIGLGGRRAVDLELFGLKAIDLYRLSQIADRLDVSVNGLL